MTKQNDSGTAYFGNMNTEAPLWLLIPKVVGSTLFSSALIIVVFALFFDEVSAFAIGFAAALAILQILVIVGFRFQNRTDLHAARVTKSGVLDKFGGFWLPACAFGAFFAWVCGNLGKGFPEFRTAFYLAAAFFSIVLSVATMLPNVRYIGGKALFVQLPIISLVTTLPILVGLYYLLKL